MFRGVAQKTAAAITVTVSPVVEAAISPRNHLGSRQHLLPDQHGDH